jgi:O-acetylhomoserine (thiol)-lyase
MKIAQYLEKHPMVDWVRYPGLPSDPGHPFAKKYLKKGFGGMVVFGIKGGREAGEKMVNSCILFTHLANVGDVRSLIIHPGSTTHSQLSDEDQRGAGVAPEMIRLSVGLEDTQDLIADLDQAFSHIHKMV